MGGLRTRKRGGGNYLKIMQGGLAKEWRKGKPTEDEIPWDPETGGKMELHEKEIQEGKNKGNIVYYVLYNEIEGHITSIKLEDTDYGEHINLVLDAGLDKFNISFKADSTYGEQFIGKIQNVDLSKEVVLSPWKMEAEEWKKFTKDYNFKGSSKVGLTVYQDDEKIESIYGKKDDGKIELPKWEVKLDRKGNFKEWDKEEYTDALFEAFEKFLAENFDEEEKKPEPQQEKPAKKESKPKRQKAAAGDDSDLPF